MQPRYSSFQPRPVHDRQRLHTQRQNPYTTLSRKTLRDLVAEMID